ncbi:MAG TPA: ABC transporter ATP-binding protein [Candidatus Paceibacterota bacterium]
MIEVRNLTKAFRDGEVETRVLKGINLKASNGEFIAIMGRSGAGKSTLMYQMSLLDEPTSGEVLIDDQPASKLSASKKTYFRLIQFGYVFQDYALIPELTALENVLLPLLMQNIPLRTARQQARESLARVGLGDHLNQLPSQLSGGEQQRVSISRAVAHRPKVLFADEPTANLDNQSSQLVMDTFLELHRSGQTIIMVTHEEIYARLAEKIIHLDDGQIVAI